MSDYNSLNNRSSLNEKNENKNVSNNHNNSIHPNPHLNQRQSISPVENGYDTSRRETTSENSRESNSNTQNNEENILRKLPSATSDRRLSRLRRRLRVRSHLRSKGVPLFDLDARVNSYGKRVGGLSAETDVWGAERFRSKRSSSFMATGTTGAGTAKHAPGYMYGGAGVTPPTVAAGTTPMKGMHPGMYGGGMGPHPLPPGGYGTAGGGRPYYVYNHMTRQYQYMPPPTTPTTAPSTTAAMPKAYTGYPPGYGRGGYGPQSGYMRGAGMYMGAAPSSLTPSSKPGMSMPTNGQHHHQHQHHQHLGMMMGGRGMGMGMGMYYPSPTMTPPPPPASSPSSSSPSSLSPSSSSSSLPSTSSTHQHQHHQRFQYQHQSSHHLQPNTTSLGGYGTSPAYNNTPTTTTTTTNQTNSIPNSNSNSNNNNNIAPPSSHAAVSSSTSPTSSSTFNDK